MTRRYGRAPRGRRCLDSAPHGHWETTTFVGALRRCRLTAPLVTDGPMDGEMFLAYVRQFLCPTLQPGDTVILDNLSSHQVAGVEAAIIASGARRWISCRPGFFLPVRVLSRLFRRLFLEHLQATFDAGKLLFFSSLERLADPKAFAAYLAPLHQTEWVVYAKRPFGGPEQVLNYLGRYTHRGAISNNRLLDIDIDNGKVCFRWKDYRHHDQQKMMTLEADEFIRRFLLHVLPDGFQRIRHYGFLGYRYCQAKLAQCRQLLGVVLAVTTVPRPDKPGYRETYEKLTGRSLRECPVCHRGQMVTIAVLSAADRAPPVINP